MSKKCIILNTSELDGLNFNELTQTSKDTVRKKLDGSQALVSYKGNVTPSGLSSKTEYTLDQLLTILSDTDNGWEPEEEE